VQLAGIPIDLAVATRFARTQQTAQLALEARDGPLMIESGLDEIDSGSYDGAPIESYWAWGNHHDPDEPFPHGETLNEALLRYAASLRRLLSHAEPVTLIVVHEFAVGRIVQAAARLPSPPQQGFGNAIPYFLDHHAVTQAADGLESMARRPGDPHRLEAPPGPCDRRDPAMTNTRAAHTMPRQRYARSRARRRWLNQSSASKTSPSASARREHSPASTSR
jgi:Histidine phosphatase superfamily (branch 1)